VRDNQGEREKRGWRRKEKAGREKIDR